MEPDRDFLKRLGRGQPTPCPKCGHEPLVPLHKRYKRRKDNNDWQCPACGEIYRTINILCGLLDEGR